jgi:hypothetical protein
MADKVGEGRKIGLSNKPDFRLCTRKLLKRHAQRQRSTFTAQRNQLVAQ